MDAATPLRPNWYRPAVEIGWKFRETGTGHRQSMVMVTLTDALMHLEDTIALTATMAGWTVDKCINASYPHYPVGKHPRLPEDVIQMLPERRIYLVQEHDDSFITDAGIRRRSAATDPLVERIDSLLKGGN